MKIGKALVVSAVVAMMLGAGPAAAKNGIYVGASVGQTTLKINDLDLDLESFDYNADDTSYKIFVGYRFMGFFAVEGSYVDFGSLADSMDTGEGPVSVRTDLKGFDAFAMGMIPLGIADVFIKGGFVSWDADIRAAVRDIVQLDTDSGTDMVYGIGAQVRFGGIAVRGEVEFFDIKDADDLYMISLGASFTF